MTRFGLLLTIGLSLLLWLLIALGLAAGRATADVGIAHGIGPHLSDPLTPHIGRVYYKPGHKHKARELSASHAKADLDRVINDLIGVKHLRCDKLHAQYVARHGMTTPRPLKGYHGCAKYARDENYWKVRRHEKVSVTTPPTFATGKLHNAVVDSVPYQVSGVFSLTNWNHF